MRLRLRLSLNLREHYTLNVKQYLVNLSENLSALSVYLNLHFLIRVISENLRLIFLTLINFYV
jgi:hypothetical protein